MRKTTYRLPSKLRNEMWACLKYEGYSSRSKSRWVREALVEYLDKDKDRGFTRVGLSDDIEPNVTVEVIYLNDELFKRIKEATTIIRKQTPLIEGVQSAIIRAAVRWRIENRYDNIR